MNYARFIRSTRHALRMFFSAYRVTVIVSGRRTVYACSNLAECLGWLNANGRYLQAYSVQRCGLVRHRVVLGVEL